MNVVTPQLQWQVEHLLARYVHALDDDRLEDWPDFFSANGRYRITTTENHARGLPLCIVQADSPAMMRDRVAALRHANIYEAQGYRHVVSSTLLTRVEDEVVEAISNFQVVRIMHDGASMLFATGRYVDRMRLGVSAVFEDKLVLLDSRRVDTLLAIPL
jgi:anthranilate 1,2-dioxygenase small subunit